MSLNDSGPSSLHLLNEYLGVLCFYRGPSGSDAAVQLHVTGRHDWSLGGSSLPQQWTDSNGIRELITGPRAVIPRSHRDRWHRLCLQMLHLIETKWGSCCPECRVSPIISHIYSTDDEGKVRRERESAWLISGMRVSYSQAEELTLIRVCRSAMKELTCGGLALGLDLHIVVAVTQFHIVFFPPPCVTDHNRKMSM